MKVEAVCLLQNAWSGYYAGREWPRESWLDALYSCRSGQRLAVAFPDHKGVWYDNTTPVVGADPNSVVPPDIEHVRNVLIGVAPRVVVACGKQAARVATDLWRGPLIITPHPAYRLVTNEVFHQVRKLIADKIVARVLLTQLRTGVAITEIGEPATKRKIG